MMEGKRSPGRMKTGRRLRAPVALAALVVAVSTTRAAAQTAWTQLAPTGGPPAVRLGLTALMDAANDRLIVYGGEDTANNERGDVWVLSNADGQGGTPTWTNITPGSGPSARAYHAAAYDPANNRMILFGGNPNVGNCFVTLNDVWVLANANGLGGAASWTQLAPTGPAPSRRNGHTAVYDPGSNRLIVFGGGDACGTGQNDVWVLTNANGLGGTPQWIQLNPAGVATPARSSHTAVYDAANNRMIVFAGGVVGPVSNDVWVLTHANGLGGTPAWQQLAPTGTLPSERYSHVAAYDATANRMLVFGGGTAAGRVNDVWTLSNANGLGTPRWRQQSPSGTPPAPRDFSAGGYVAASRRLVIHAGRAVSGTFVALNDAWVYSDTPAAGVLHFSSPATSAREATGTALVEVTRDEGTVGAVSVTYATSDGTATSPSDYLATTGTLEFADGESSKLITLSLVVDGTPEPHETFGLALSAPAGGAVLGSPSSSTVTILDDSTAYPPSWSPVGPLGSRRELHAATLLLDGKVLVVGGTADNAALRTAELYDPATGAWTPAGSMSTARQYHTATLLPNGKVLVCGGRPSPGSNPLASAELYDPSTGTWSATGSLVTARDLHDAVLLPNGKVLVTGGNSCFGCGARLASAEEYNPATGTWAGTGSMGVGRVTHAMTVLSTGKVLVTGGFSGSAELAATELYDQGTRQWSFTASLPMARGGGHTATALANGKVLVAGGFSGGTTVTAAHLYDPASGTWANTGSLGTARGNHQAALLPSGKVLVAGGGGPIASAVTAH